MPASPARAAAFDILLRVERESSYAAELLHSTAFQGLALADHALTTQLVMGVLRWRSRLDAEIAQASSQPFQKLDPEILIALRIALYQFRHLDRIPQRAALNESVELVKRARKRSAAPFVNAVLRKLSMEAPLGSSVHPGVSESPESISTSWAHPLWLVERWVQNFGLPATGQICHRHQSTPTTAIRLRTPTAESELTAEGISLLPGAFLSSARLVQSGNVTHTNAFRQGHIAIQDEASQLVAALLGQDSNHRILDCCAAPGGKTLAIADHNPEAAITAVEVHPHRARLMQNRFPKNSTQIQTIVADARQLPLNAHFARVLADVPCSGTGTLARHPEIKWRLRFEDLADLHARQLAILRAAMAHVAPGGRLIYSTCSLEKEENENVIEEALTHNTSFRILDCRSALADLKALGQLTYPDLDSLTRGPCLRTIPGSHPCEGFFAAILERS